MLISDVGIIGFENEFSIVDSFGNIKPIREYEINSITKPAAT